MERWIIALKDFLTGKELFRDMEHRMIWLVCCLILFLLIWMGIMFRARFGMD